MENIPVDVKSLSQLPEFRNLTVEEAIRLLGKKEKEVINQERERVLNELRSKLDNTGSKGC